MKEPGLVETAVDAIYANVTTLSTKWKLISMVGHHEGVGHKLVSEDAAKRLEARWRADVRAAGVDALVAEGDLLRVLLVTKRDAASDEPALAVPDSPALTLAVLMSARSEVRSQAVDSRAVHRSPVLAWDALVDLFGGEEQIRIRVQALQETEPRGSSELLELVEKYLSGWRPRDFDER